MDNPITEWLVNVSNETVPSTIGAINIGLFETPEGWTCYIALCNEYDKDDSDWACDEVIKVENRYLRKTFLKETTPDWESFIDYIKPLVIEAISSPKILDTWLGRVEVITIGFDDGELIRIK